MYERVLTTVDTHTAGEPTRVVLSGVPPLSGSMPEKRRQLRKEYDVIRQTLMQEPRGHADMFGAVLVAPSDSQADLGVVFMDSDGYLSMCGHGSMGVVAVALATGLVPRREPETEVVMDTPAGLVRARARIEAGKVSHISVENVPAFLYCSGVRLELTSGSLDVEIAFGGNFFALVPAKALGLSMTLSQLPKIIERGMEIRSAVNEQVDVVHPVRGQIQGVELVEIYDEHPADDIDCRNVVVFGKGQVDRSPCGTGTSAKMAALYAQEQLKLNQPFVNEGIIGTRFTGRLLREEQVGTVQAVVPEITGMAYVTGFHQFVVDGSDPLKSGFHLDTRSA